MEVDSNMMDSNGFMPFRIAFLERNWDTIESLLANGADPRTMKCSNESDYRTFLTLCGEEDRIAVINLLFEKKVINCDDDNFISLLILSLVKGQNFLFNLRDKDDDFRKTPDYCIKSLLEFCVDSHQIMFPEKFIEEILGSLLNTPNKTVWREKYSAAFVEHLFENDFMNLHRMDVDRLFYECLQLEWDDFLSYLLEKIDPNVLKFDITTLLCECGRQGMGQLASDFIEKIDFNVHKVDINQLGEIIKATTENICFNYELISRLIEKSDLNFDKDIHQLLTTCIEFGTEMIFKCLLKPINKRKCHLNLEQLLNVCIEKSKVEMGQILLRYLDLNFYYFDKTQLLLSCIKGKTKPNKHWYLDFKLLPKEMAYTLISKRNIKFTRFSIDANRIFFACVEKNDAGIAAALLRKINPNEFDLNINSLFHLCIEKHEICFAVDLLKRIDHKIHINWCSLLELFLKEYIYKQKTYHSGWFAKECIKLTLLFSESAAKPNFYEFPSGSSLSLLWDNCKEEVKKLNSTCLFYNHLPLLQFVKLSVDVVANILNGVDSQFYNVSNKWYAILRKNFRNYYPILIIIIQNGWTRWHYLKKGEIAIEHSKLSVLQSKLKDKIWRNCSNSDIDTLLRTLKNKKRKHKDMVLE